MATINATARAASSLRTRGWRSPAERRSRCQPPGRTSRRPDQEEGLECFGGEEEHDASERLCNETAGRDGASVRGARGATPDGEAANDGGNATRASSKPGVLPSERGRQNRYEMGDEAGLREEGQSHSDAECEKRAVMEKAKGPDGATASTGALDEANCASERGAVGGLAEPAGCLREHEDARTPRVTTIAAPTTIAAVGKPSQVMSAIHSGEKITPANTSTIECDTRAPTGRLAANHGDHDGVDGDRTQRGPADAGQDGGGVELPGRVRERPARARRWP